MALFIKGIILGFVIVLPGMSGGTVFLIFGIYEDIVKDILKLNLKPYIPLIIGVIIGIFLSAFAFAMFFENYRDFTVAFLLGCLLASVKPVLKECPEVTKGRIIMIFVGLIIGLLVVTEPLGVLVETEEISYLTLFIGGILSSAAMIIPGIPGSSVLILFGIYDVIIFSISNFNMPNLLVFGLGSVIGIYSLLNILGKLYEKYKGLISYFFAGLIVGSARGILPSQINLLVIILFLIGFSTVWIWSDKEF